MPTELQPPPLDDKEHHATVYVINLYAVKNSSSNESEQGLENEIVEIVPDLLGKCKNRNSNVLFWRNLFIRFLPF